MSMWDKLRTLIWLKGLVGGSKSMGNFAQKLDGYKSLAGLLIVFAYYALPQFTSIHVPDYLYKFGLSLSGVGLAHKLEKGTGLVSKGLDALKAALEAITAKEAQK